MFEGVPLCRAVVLDLSLTNTRNVHRIFCHAYLSTFCCEDFCVSQCIYKRIVLDLKIIFFTGKLKGMTENSGKVELPEDKINDKFICTCVYTVANVLQVASSDEKVYKFASKTLSEGVLALVSISVKENTANLVVNCEKMVIGTMLLKDLKRVLSKS